MRKSSDQEGKARFPCDELRTANRACQVRLGVKESPVASLCVLTGGRARLSAKKALDKRRFIW